MLKASAYVLQKKRMVYYTYPEIPFCGFDEEFDFSKVNNMMTNLIRFCGFRSLHQDSWLYKWLQEQIKYFKFSGEDEFRMWCTYPSYNEFWEKIEPRFMKVDKEQMERWMIYLRDHQTVIRNECSGDSWSKYYKTNNR